MIETQERGAMDAAARLDTYKTILLHAERGHAATNRVEAAATLARDLDAVLIGLGAETYDLSPVADPYMGYATGEWVTLLQEQVEKDLAAAEMAFRRDAAGAQVQWRSAQDEPARALLRNAHAVDLIVVGPRLVADNLHAADPGDVIMGAGRPVLMAPPTHRFLSGKAIVIAWKNTPHCRRAVADALPFLRRAEEVIVHTVCQGGESETTARETDDLVANLARHGVVARPLVTSAASEGVTLELERIAELNGADLIVCGAYGHSRMREWAFGGVTDDLIRNPPCFVLMSH